jgi:hypothetical protein
LLQSSVYLKGWPSIPVRVSVIRLKVSDPEKVMEVTISGKARMA